MQTNKSKGLIALPLFALMSSLPLTLDASSPHVHGLANIFVAIDQQQVVVEVESPSGNILGFEHIPHNEEQKKQLKTALTVLKSHQSLIDFGEADCQQMSMTLENPIEGNSTGDGHHDEHEKDSHDDHEHHDEHKKDSHDEHGHHDEHKKDSHDEHGHHDEHKKDKAETHSEFHISYTLQCKKMPNTATITAYDSFSGFESIQVNWLTPEKQGSNKTAINQRQVAFN